MKKMMKKVAAIMLSVALAVPSMGISVSADETLVATGTWDAYKWTDVTGEIDFIYGHLWDENKVADENANFAYCVNADGSWAIGPRCIIKYKNVDLTKVESITLDTNYNGSTMKIGDCTAESTDTTEVTYDGRTYQYSSNGWKPFGSDVITSWERSASDNMTFLVPEASKVENATFGIIYDNSSSPKQIKSLTFNMKDENAPELTAQDKANEWISTHQTILDKELETVTNEDMTSVETALETFEVLEAEVQALLATEKANLDAKLEKIMALPKTETGTWDAYKWTDVTGEIEFIYGYVADEDVSTDENINFVKNVNDDGSWTICPRGIIKYTNVDLTKVESITLDTNYNENAMYLGDCTVAGGATTEVSYNGRTYQYARGWKPFGSGDVTSWERSAENNMTFLVPETAKVENATFAIMYNNSSSPKQINSLTFNLGGTTEPTAEELASAWKETHAEILGKTVETVETGDADAIELALAAYEGLSDDVKVLIATEKALLDSLKAEIETVVSEYTVTFKNGNDEVDSQLVAAGNTATAPEEPTKPNAFFYGWYDEDGIEFDPEVAVEADATYFAAFYDIPVDYLTVGTDVTIAYTSDEAASNGWFDQKLNYINNRANYILDGGEGKKVDLTQVHVYGAGDGEFRFWGSDILDEAFVTDGTTDNLTQIGVVGLSNEAWTSTTFEDATGYRYIYMTLKYNNYRDKAYEILLGGSVAEAEITENYKLGDVSNDGAITLKDALLALKLTVASDNDFTTQPVLSADVNKNGMIDVQDVLAILQKSNGKEVDGLE